MIEVEAYARENNLVQYSTIADKNFQEFFHKVKIDTAVEIGTYRGISAAYIAQFAKKVYTFDIVDYPEKYKMWRDLKVADRIVFNTVKGRYDSTKNFEGIFEDNDRAVDIKSILDGLDFDFAFIDGEHTYKNVKADFELVKKCGRVLFHDVHRKYKFVRKFVKELGNVEIDWNIGYWSKNGR